jgi:LPS export ABC transporter protein LptC
MAGMTGPAPRAPFQRLRRAILGALALALAGLGALYWLGRQGAPQPAPEEPVDDPVLVGAKEGAVAASEGFEFEQQVDGKPVFRIAGDRFRADKEGRVELDGVRLDLYREGEPYRVTASRAIYDPETREAQLLGGVEIAGGDGFTLATEALDLAAGGNELVSRGPVRLAQGAGRTGSGSRIRMSFTRDTYVLEGPTRLQAAAHSGSPAVDLRAERIAVSRREHRIRAEQDVVLNRGGDRIACQQLALHYAPDDTTLRTAQARFLVEGRIAGAPAPEGTADEGWVDFRAKEATLEFEGDPARAVRLALESERGEQVRLLSPGEAGTMREIAARYLVATLADGRPVSAQGFQPVYFAEYPVGEPDQPIRVGRADQVEVGYDGAGRPTRLTFVGRVSFRDRNLEGSGERGYFDLEGGQAELFGERVRLASERGELFAPHVTWDRRTGLMTADGGVQAQLEPGAARLVAGAQAGARGPVRVEAREAIFRESPRGFLFRGAVQAWQGESVLFADQLRGEEPEQRLSAAGGVKTLWRREAAGAAAGAPTTEVRSDTLAYRRTERSLTYAGAVRLLEEGRTLRADELAAELGEEDRIRRMVATGSVRLEDPADGRTVEGDRADYDAEARTATVEGDPVVLRDRQGTTIRGPRLLYDFAAGSARMLAALP